ncbi:MAG: PHP domain-containing protein [Limnochordia bacterium]
MVGRFDLHLHTRFSDGQGEVEDKAKKALEMGLDLMAITDHFGEPLDYRMNLEELQELHAIIKGQNYPLPVLLGIETGIEGTVPPELWGKVDLIIRSIHYLRQPVQAKSPFDPLYWGAYKEEVLALLRAGGDVLGHVEGYMPLPLGDRKTTFEERRAMEREVAKRFFAKDWQEQVARLAAARQVAIELHAATKTPRLDFIRLCQKEGCIFSVGSDAHGTESVGQIDWALEVIEELGIPQSQLLPYVKGWLK